MDYEKQNDPERARPEHTSWSKVIDRGKGESFDTQEWAQSDDTDECNAPVELEEAPRMLRAFRKKRGWRFDHVTPTRGKSESEQRQAFARKMAKLPTQQAVLVRNGLPAVRSVLAISM
ncbi:MAG TPA: hypothetical protein VFN10_21340 [Thermoanaerobaculia bacterium]|nr:hypothetical protein [Thermoanaerobaculia bacterium]